LTVKIECDVTVTERHAEINEHFSVERFLWTYAKNI